MSIGLLCLLLAVIAAATYFQTVTGFGLAMIVMGVTSGFGLVPVPYIATVVSFVMLVNSGVALPGRLHQIDWPVALIIMLGIVPSGILGVLLLDYLSTDFSRLLEFLLGVVIVYSGITSAFQPPQLKTKSSAFSFFTSGFFSGLLGGMFGMPGPPIIFHLYRQPIPLIVVRNMLLLIFAMISATRTLFVMAQGQLDPDTYLVSVLAIPVVALMTIVAHKYPPPLRTEAIRRIAYTVLVIIGVALMIGATLA